MYEVIGKCSICDGKVVGFTGPFFGTPPVAYCQSCGATEDRSSNVMPMIPTSQEVAKEHLDEYYKKSKNAFAYLESYVNQIFKDK